MRHGWIVAIMISSLPLAPALAMSREVAISAGSFFSAAARCEAKNLITPGQSDRLLRKLGEYLSKRDRANMQAGYSLGDAKSSVYVVQQHDWSLFTPDDASCYRVQGVLDDYKSQLGVD